MKILQKPNAIFQQSLLALLVLSLISPCLLAGNLLSERTYKRLNQIHKLIEKEDYKGALGHLDKLMVQSGSREYDKAIIQQTYGYVYEAMEQPDKAINQYEAAISANILPVNTAQGVRINLARLYYLDGNIKKAIDMFELWYGKQKTPNADALVFGGSLYAENNNYNKAASFIREAINMTRNPSESWYRRIAAIYLKMEDYENASKVLQILVSKNPENLSYWKQLSASYYYSGNEEKSLTSLLLAYKKGLLKNEKDYLDLARFSYSRKIPYQASQIIEDGLKKGIVARNKKNIELLGNIYMQAKENERAIKYLLEAADLSNDAEIYLKVANLYANSNQWEKALKVLDNNFENNQNLKDQGLILKGIALFELGHINQSRKAFQQISKNNKSADLANKWLNYLSFEQ